MNNTVSINTINLSLIMVLVSTTSVILRQFLKYSFIKIHLSIQFCDQLALKLAARLHL